MLLKNCLLCCFLFFKDFAMFDFQLQVNKEYIPYRKENTYIFLVDQIMFAWHVLLLF